MKIKAHGPYTIKRSDGTMFSPMPDQEIEVDPDTDPALAEWFRSLDPSLVTIEEDEPAKAKADADKAKAEPKLAAAGKKAAVIDVKASTGKAGESA